MTAHRTVAIHQPNFFPWLGFFDKVARADVFVVLDHVQFPKSRPGNWSNRVRLAVHGRGAWVTMPVVRAFEGVRRIDETQIDNQSPWRRKFLQLLRSSYGRAAAFHDVFGIVEPLIENPTPSLVEYNMGAIGAICERIGVPTRHMVRSSTLGLTSAKTQLLADIVTRVGGTRYLAGDGAGGYQDDDLFGTRGIEVVYQQFRHPTYFQKSTSAFVPGLSILDAIFHCGFEGTARLLHQTHPLEGDVPA